MRIKIRTKHYIEEKYNILNMVISNYFFHSHIQYVEQTF